MLDLLGTADDSYFKYLIKAELINIQLAIKIDVVLVAMIEI
jgi:hypothetical protein